MKKSDFKRALLWRAFTAAAFLLGVGGTAVFTSCGGDSADKLLAATYTVAFDTQGGTAVPSQQVAEGAQAERPAAPAKPNPAEGDKATIFADWFETPSGEAKFDFGKPIMADATVYAHWITSGEQRELTAAVTAPSGTLSGAAVAESADEAAAGSPYVTAALAANGPAENPLDPPSAVWTVTFDTGEGSAVKPEEVRNEGLATRPADPTRSGWAFGGWFRDAAFQTPWDFGADTVGADITLYAKWLRTGSGSIVIGILNSGSITIDGWDGGVIGISGVSGSDAKTFIATGFDNAKWYVDGSFRTTGNTLTVRAADYNRRTHSVTFMGEKSGAPYTQTFSFTITGARPPSTEQH